MIESEEALALLREIRDLVKRQVEQIDQSMAVQEQAVQRQSGFLRVLRIAMFVLIVMLIAYLAKALF